MQETLYEFANIGYKRTGLDNIYIYAYSQADKEVQHGPRIKVSNIYNKFSSSDNFTIDVINKRVVNGVVKITSKELEDVMLWIGLNKDEIITYWKSKGEMDTDEFLNSLSKI